MSDNKITNLADPQSDKDAINKQYLEKSHVKPSHYNNEFKYLMTDKLGWTSVHQASVSNYSSTLTLNSALASQSNYTFRISSGDAVIHKVMYPPNFYDLDSIQFHTIMIQRN